MTWIGQADQGYVAVGAGASSIVASFDPGAAAMVKPTIVRSRGVLSVRSASSAADVSVVGAFGMCVVSDQVFTAGAASVPGPWTDGDWDGWFVWQAFSLSLEVTTDISRIINDRIFEIDSKAMRKVNENETILLVVESQAVAIEVSVPIRVLLKLS